MVTASSGRSSAIDPGTVALTLPLDTPPAEVWRALTAPALVERWFGTLTGMLALGQYARLDFGDGDFFDIETLRCEPPQLLEYTWRFLGIGPLDTITWHIATLGRGSLVTVLDGEPGRSYQSARELKEGWLDFTQRLERFLATGQPSRYDWRREFDGSIELAGEPSATWETLFAPANQARWLPLRGGILEEGELLVVGDGAEPAMIRIADVRWEPPSCVRFQVTQRGWLQPTHCELKLSAHAEGSVLSISHVGWEGISQNGSRQLQQRTRFCAEWISALQRARQLID
jgi:uncharacterized protein YndB with AHSA1/START domain